MENYIGYFFVFLLIVLLVLFLMIDGYVRLLIRKNKYKKIQEGIAITNSLLDLAKKMDCRKDYIIKYDNLSIYLSQVDYILKTDPYTFEKISVSLLKDVPDDKLRSLNKLKFFEEYNKASRQVKILVDELSQILGRIYAIKHPVKHKYSELKMSIAIYKKKVLLQILKLLSRYIDNMSNHTKRKELDKKIEYKEFCNTTAVNGQTIPA